MHIPTPAAVRRLYRIVLRYAGAAVLYSRPATPNLRRLYRPEFDIWMAAAKRGRPEVLEARAEWEEFASRVQNTLGLLRRSSEINDVTHHLTKNMADMQYYMDPSDRVRSRLAHGHDVTLQSMRPEFLPGKRARSEAEVAKCFAWDAFAEVVGMAEASSGLLLGKVRPRKQLEEET